MMRTLFPNRQDVAALHEKAEAPQRARSQGFSLDDIRYHVTDMEQTNNIGRIFGDELAMASVVHFLSPSHLELSDGPFSDKPDQLDQPEQRTYRPSQKWERTRVMLPCAFPKPDGGREIYGFSAFYNSISTTDLRDLALYFADFGAAFVASPAQLQDDLFKGMTPLQFGISYQENLGAREAEFYPLAICLTQSPVVLLGGNVRKNPFYWRYFEDQKTLKEMLHAEIKGIRFTLDPRLDRTHFMNDEVEYQLWGALQSRTVDIQRFYSAKYSAKQPLIERLAGWANKWFERVGFGRVFDEKSYQFPFNYYGKTYQVTVPRPLPSLTLETFVQKMMQEMPDEEKEFAQQVWDGIQPVAVSELLKVHHELPQKRYGSFTELAKIPARRYDDMLRAHEKLFMIWRDQTLAGYERKPGILFHEDQEGQVSVTVEGASYSPKEGVLYDHTLCGSRALLLFNPKFYHQVLDEIASWKNVNAQTLLITHRYRVAEIMEKTPELGEDILRTIGERIEACRGQQ
ncbi:hypothetical protein HYS47_04420 [Candidatus Woesearchaeota archaeon]|nr:hypothetical protein [Candidatus Woesearchaeota archaeon]